MINYEEVIKYINMTGEKSKIYVGGDSRKFLVNNVWMAYYATVIVVHINGNNGCRIFGQKEKEIDYDKRKNRPSTRLMNEVYKITDLYMNLKSLLKSKDIEIHLDINPKKEHVSNMVMTQAIGYVTGMTGIKPVIKPDSFAASSAADMFLR